MQGSYTPVGADICTVTNVNVKVEKMSHKHKRGKRAKLFHTFCDAHTAPEVSGVRSLDRAGASIERI